MSRTRRQWVGWLEHTLDAAAAQKPAPGRVALHRLNRTEYANAVDDLLALKIDVKALLPKDDESDGFDNVANVLKVSPSFLEQYIAAARVISEMAVGDANAKRDSRVYYMKPGTNQNYHVEGMPLGTRGGMLVEHLFPADGQYQFDIGGLARARYVEGLEYRHTLILTIDGLKVFENEIGGREDVAAVDLRQAAAVAELNGRFERIRVPVTAGPHKVGATFVARTMAESDAVLQPFVPGRRRSRHHRRRREPAENTAARDQRPVRCEWRQRYAEPQARVRVPPEDCRPRNCRARTRSCNG